MDTTDSNGDTLWRPPQIHILWEKEKGFELKVFMIVLSAFRTLDFKLFYATFITALGWMKKIEKKMKFNPKSREYLVIAVNKTVVWW